MINIAYRLLFISLHYSAKINSCMEKKIHYDWLFLYLFIYTDLGKLDYYNKLYILDHIAYRSYENKPSYYRLYYF